MPVSQRASVRDGVSGREKGVRTRVRLLIPHSGIGSRSLHQENMGEEENNEGREEMDTLLTLSCTDRVHTSQTRELQC